MTETTDAPNRSPATRSRRTWQAWTLAAVEVFVTCQAVSGDIGLMTDSWQLPTEWLVRTPFTTWSPSSSGAITAELVGLDCLTRWHQ